MPNFPFSFFKSSSSGVIPIPVDEVITFDTLTNATLATTAQVNASTFGTVLAAFTFADGGGNHSPANSIKGSTTVTWPAWPQPFSVGGVTVPVTSNMAAQKDAQLEAVESGSWSFNTNSTTKFLYGAMFYWDAPTANQVEGRSMDILTTQTSSAGPAGALGTWFQVNYALSTLDFEVENNSTTTFNSSVRTPGGIVTGRVYVFQAIVDYANGTQTNVWFDTSTTPWNQVGQEFTFSTAVGTAANIGGPFQMFDFDNATWTGHALFYLKNIFFQNNPTGFINVTLGLRHPDNFVATVTGFTSVSLAWSAVSQASSYDIDQSTDGGSTWSNISSSLAATSLAVPRLTSNQAYVFRIRSHVGAQLSNYVSSNSVTPHTIDMLGYWELDNPGSGVATDLTTNGNNGTFPNGGTQVVGVGGVGHATSFNGSTQFALFGDPALFQLTGDLTVNVYVNFTVLPPIGAYTFISKNSSTSNGYAFFLIAGAGGFIGTTFLTDATAQGSPSFVTGTWYMLTMTYTLATKALNVFVNASNVGTATGTNNGIIDAGNLIVGQAPASYGFGAGQFLNGEVQAFKIWNRVLPQAEITALAGTLPP